MKYNITLQVKSLGDAAAFEELAKEMGISFSLTTVDAVPEPPKPKQRRHHRVTPELMARVKNLIKMHPNASDARIIELGKLGHSTPTTNRIRNNQYDNKGKPVHR